MPTLSEFQSGFRIVCDKCKRTNCDLEITQKGFVVYCKSCCNAHFFHNENFK